MLKHFKAAPLPSSFMFIAILGFLISAIYFNRLGASWSIAFLIVFVVMFIASFISTVKAPIDAEIAMDHQLRKLGTKLKIKK
jgi:hypothetical protein